MKPNNLASLGRRGVGFHSDFGDAKQNGTRKCTANSWLFWWVFVQPNLRTVAIRRSLLPTDHGVRFTIALVAYSVDLNWSLLPEGLAIKEAEFWGKNSVSLLEIRGFG